MRANTALRSLSRHPGVLTQFAIVIGIMITQSMGLQLATPRTWRVVLLFSSGLSLAQLLIGPAIVESPVWLNRHGLLRDKDASVRRLWKGTHVIRSPDGAFRPHVPHASYAHSVVPS